MPSDIATARIETPIGMITVAAKGAMLISCRIHPQISAESHDFGGNVIIDDAVRQVRDWFAGRRRRFDLPLRPASTARGEELRAGIAAIPYGTTLTYGDVAAKLGSAARAVGGACRTNAFPIIIPCHRVVSRGSTEFYSGGDGPRTKAWLLAFEQGRLYPYDQTPNDQPRFL